MTATFKASSATKELARNLEETFDIMDESNIDISEKLDFFRFYFSGLAKGFEIALRNAGLDPNIIKPQIINEISVILEDFDSGLIESNEAWSKLANRLT